MLVGKSVNEIKYKQKKGKEEKAPTEAESGEDGQFEEKMDGKIEKKEKVKKEELRSHGTDSTSRLSKKIKGTAMDGRKEKKKKRKKEEFGSEGSDVTSMVSRDMEESEVDMVEKKNNKRKRVVYGEDLGNKEKNMRMSEGNSASLDKAIHDDEMVDLSHENLKKKKKGKSLRDAGAIELEEGSNKERRDDKIQEREKDKYEVEKKMKMKKKDNSGSSGYIEKEINEEDEKAEYMGNEEDDKQTKEGSEKNKRVMKASKSEEKDESENKGKQKETATGNNEAKNDKNRKESKKVHFSDEVKVFSAPSDSEQKTKHNKTKKRDECEGVVWGERFTKEEDMILLKAIDDYIQVSNFNSFLLCISLVMFHEVAWCSFAVKITQFLIMPNYGNTLHPISCQIS
jgi:hypothetical protein